MKRASDDGSKNFFRTERVFLSEGQYFFATREGIDQGPFVSAGDAEDALRHYVQTQRAMERLRERGRGGSEQTFTHDDVAQISRDIRAAREPSPDEG